MRPPVRPHGLPTAAYKGWLALKFRQGKTADGRVKYSEGFKNVDTGEEFFPENGHSGEPPYPTGDLAMTRHNSDLYRQNYDQIRWER